MDGKRGYFLLDDLHFTHWELSDSPWPDTILDSQLVFDVNRNGVETLRFYTFVWWAARTS